MKTAHETFVEIHTHILANNGGDHVINFDPSWNNGTGYLSALVHHETKLCEGSRFATVTDNGRKVIGIVTEVGNVVIFERYKDNDQDIIVVNRPAVLNEICPEGSQTSDNINFLTGGKKGWNRNIGEIIENIKTQIDRVRARKLLESTTD